MYVDNYVLCYCLLSECDSCVHLLLDEVEHLDINITEIKKDLKYLSVGVNAIKRLESANRTVYELRVSTLNN